VTVTLPPGCAVVALTHNVGVDVTMLKGLDGDRPPPGAGLKTETWAVPATARSAAEMAARNCVLLTKVVTRSAPFQRTIDEPTNPLTLTVSDSAAAPAGAESG
jgi:hypothetical protein